MYFQKIIFILLIIEIKVNCNMYAFQMFFLLLFSILTFSQTELKFNLATAPLLIPNIGIEVKLSEKLGYQLDTSASFYNDIEGSPFHMTQIFNEIRFMFLAKSFNDLKSTDSKLIIDFSQ